MGPYLFTKTLLPLLRKTAQASAPGAVRVAWAGSMATELVAPRDGGVSFGVDGNPVVHADQWANYGQSKVGNVFLATELAKRYREDGIVSVVCVISSFSQQCACATRTLFNGLV